MTVVLVIMLCNVRERETMLVNDTPGALTSTTVFILQCRLFTRHPRQDRHKGKNTKLNIILINLTI